MKPGSLRCPSGHENMPGARFCPSCGSPVGAKAPVSDSNAAGSSASRGRAVRPKVLPAKRWLVVTALCVAVALGAAAVAVIVAVQRGGDSGRRESFRPVTLEASDVRGPDPFTESVSSVADAQPVASIVPADAPRGGVVQGTATGLYAARAFDAPCDTGKLLAALKNDPARAQAWARTVGISADEIEGLLGRLTAVQLTRDTRITNHGFRGARVTDREVVLQAGTAVLVDDHGVPRVKCSCGNPLTASSTRNEGYAGKAWEGFAPEAVVKIEPGPVTDSLTVTDPSTGANFDRPVGSNGSNDALPCLDEGVLVANEEGVHLRRNCEWVTLVPEPSVRAFGDGAGGIVYQPEGREVRGGYALLGTESPIKRIRSNADAPELVEAPEPGGALDLITVWRVDGTPNVLYRKVGPGASPDDTAIPPVLLLREVLGTGEATTIVSFEDVGPAGVGGTYWAGGRTVYVTSTRQGFFTASWMDPHGGEAPEPRIPSLASAEPVEIPPGPTQVIMSPDGSRAALLTAGGIYGQVPSLRIVDLATGNEIASQELADSGWWEVGDFDGRRAIVSTYDNATRVTTVEVVDLASGQRVPITLTGTASFLSAPGR